MSIFPVPLFAPWFGAQPANCPIYVGLEACAKKTAVKFSLPFCRRGLEACAKKTATPRVAPRVLLVIFFSADRQPAHCSRTRSSRPASSSSSAYSARVGTRPRWRTRGAGVPAARGALMCFSAAAICGRFLSRAVSFHRITVKLPPPPPPLPPPPPPLLAPPGVAQPS